MLAAYLWRLIPANPILLRVVSVAGKRWRDAAVRTAYLAGLIIFVLFALLSGGDSRDLSALSKISIRAFTQISYLQMGFVALLAPVFTAGAISQQRDSQTYDVLLATPLTSGQIVLGGLLSRLFFLFALLLAGLPIFTATQIFGGVAMSDVFTSFFLAAVTALVTGALAIAISTFNVGTRATIFRFYLLIGGYLAGVFLIDRFGWLSTPMIDPNTMQVVDAQTSWVTGLHPFLALRVVLDQADYAPPAMAELPAHLRFWPIGWMLSSPVSFYLGFMSFLSFVLVLPSILLLRRIAQSAGQVKASFFRRFVLRKPGTNRTPRLVWSNPIAWREACTKASAARSSVTRYAFIAIGLGVAIVAAVMNAMPQEVAGRHIRAGSYNYSSRILHVVGDTNYLVTNATELKIDGNFAVPDDLGQRTLAVTDLASRNVAGTLSLTRLQLKTIPGRLTRDFAEQLLLGTIAIELAIILLIVTNAAASTVTREKEDGSLEILLTTPITSRYYIWGKLRGLVALVLPMLAVPVGGVAVFVLADIIRMGRGTFDTWLALPESLIVMPPLLVIVCAFAAIVGMFFSLQFRTTVKAVMVSAAVVVGSVGLLGYCGFALVDNSPNLGSLIVASFSPFTAIVLLVDSDVISKLGNEAGAGRFVLVAGSLISAAVYAAIVFAMYKSMVKNFDMTIRKQSR